MKILIIEDTLDVILDLRLHLSSYDLTVKETYVDGGKAMKDTYDVILCDHFMPRNKNAMPRAWGDTLYGNLRRRISITTPFIHHSSDKDTLKKYLFGKRYFEGKADPHFYSVSKLDINKIKSIIDSYQKSPKI